jgi:hypothetical protein
MLKHFSAELEKRIFGVVPPRQGARVYFKRELTFGSLFGTHTYRSVDKVVK